MKDLNQGDVVYSKKHGEGKKRITIDSVKEDGEKKKYYGHVEGSAGVVALSEDDITEKASEQKEEDDADSKEGHDSGPGAGSDADGRSSEEIKKEQEELKKSQEDKQQKPQASGNAPKQSQGQNRRV